MDRLVTLDDEPGAVLVSGCCLCPDARPDRVPHPCTPQAVVTQAGRRVEHASHGAEQAGIRACRWPCGLPLRLPGVVAHLLDGGHVRRQWPIPWAGIMKRVDLLTVAGAARASHPVPVEPGPRPGHLQSCQRSRASERQYSEGWRQAHAESRPADAVPSAYTGAASGVGTWGENSVPAKREAGAAPRGPVRRSPRCCKPDDAASSHCVPAHGKARRRLKVSQKTGLKRRRHEASGGSGGQREPGDPPRCSSNFLQPVSWPDMDQAERTGHAHRIGRRRAHPQSF